MQITIRGEMTLIQLRQALFEKLHELEDSFALHHSLGATLYFNLELTPFHGHLIVQQKGVQDAQTAYP